LITSYRIEAIKSFLMMLITFSLCAINATTGRHLVDSSTKGRNLTEQRGGMLSSIKSLPTNDLATFQKSFLVYLLKEFVTRVEKEDQRPIAAAIHMMGEIIKLPAQLRGAPPSQRVDGTRDYPAKVRPLVVPLDR
jgi:hypothetical protein